MKNGFPNLRITWSILRVVISDSLYTARYWNAMQNSFSGRYIDTLLLCAQSYTVWSTRLLPSHSHSQTWNSQQWNRLIADKKCEVLNSKNLYLFQFSSLRSIHWVPIVCQALLYIHSTSSYFLNQCLYYFWIWCLFSRIKWLIKFARIKN